MPAPTQSTPSGAGPPGQGPLAGMRVIETGAFIAGPFCAHLLADWGAEVIKVEPPGGGDQLREWGARYRGVGLWWSLMGRNKKAITLDLRRPAGQALLARLVERADVLIENFRPGTLEGWSLGPERLRELNPRLVLVRVSGYGQTGPYRTRAGFGAAAESMGGLRHLTGFPDGPPVRSGVSIGDQLAALYGALGALAALYRRDHGAGHGDVVDVAIYEAVFSVLESTLLEYDKLGVVRGRYGSRVPNIAPSNVYPALGGEYVVIGGNADTVFRRLCAAIGRPELAEDPRFATNAARGETTHQAELDRIIGEWTSERTPAAIEAHLAAAGVPASRIYTIADIAADPHFAARKMLVEVFDERIGETVKQPGVVPKFAEAPGTIAWAGPPLGAHNDEVYGDLLGLSDAERAALRAEGII